MPEAYAQPWLGLHSLNLTHTPSFDSHRKAEDVLKEAIILSTGDRGAATAWAGLSTSASTAPMHNLREMLKCSPWMVFPPLLQYTLHPNTDVPSPSLRNAHGLAPLLVQKFSIRAWVKRESFELIEFIRIGFCDLAVAVSPKAGLQLDPKPVQVWDRSTHKQRHLEVSKSSLEMKPVRVRMMSWILPMRQMCHKVVCPCLTSPPQMMRILTNARRMSLPIKMTLTLRHGKTNSSVKV